MATVTTLVDNVDVTYLVQEASTTHQHNQPSFVTLRVPTALGLWPITSRLKVVLNETSVLDFHGACKMIEHTGSESEKYTQYTYVSPAEIFEFRPARDGPASGDQGDFSKPTFIERNRTAPQIAYEILDQSINGTQPADAEGPMGIALGTFATGGVSLEGAPTDTPMQLAEIFALLGDTGQFDLVEQPVDMGDVMAIVSAYNGDHGTDRTSSVWLRFDEGSSSNCRGCRYTIDATDIMNKLWIYLGPRVGTKSDPAGDQHWAANVTGTSTFPDLPRLPASVVLAARDISRTNFYARMIIRIFDGDESKALDMWKCWWLFESWLRCKPKQLVSMTPHRGITPTFRCGDLIRVSAGTGFGGGFNAVQRVMSYSYRWGAGGVIELGEPVGQPVGTAAVVTTADQEGS